MIDEINSFKYCLEKAAHGINKLPLVVMAKKANIDLIVLFLHDFGWPKPKAFHFGPNQLMIRYLQKM